MKLSARLLPAFAALACLISLTASVRAADGSHGGLREALERNELVSFKSILDWIEARYVGKVVEVELEDEHNQLNYEVDLLTPDGDMIEFEFNARDGKLLSISGQNIERARRK